LIAVIVLSLVTPKAAAKLKYLSTIWLQLALEKHQTS